jgi:predicted RNase H-like HicB family nuclease
MIHRFLVVIERTGENFSAYSPDLPGCIATGNTREEAKERMHSAIDMHVRELIKEGIPVPESHSSATFVSVRTE